MKVRNFFAEVRRTDAELIAAFGQARLIKTPDHIYELRGGSAEDRREAAEWISLFLHEASVRDIQPPASAITPAGP